MDNATRAIATTTALSLLLHSAAIAGALLMYEHVARLDEGIATVAFVLHPDGSIEDARLVVSSHARLLDRAALAAVEQVEPFEAAKDYLKTAETFQVDIAFDLL